MWAHAIKCKGDMRTAAVIAGAAQLLFGIFMIAPQIGWQYMVMGYGFTQLQHRLTPLLEGEQHLEAELPVTVETPASQTTMFCQPPKPKYAPVRVALAMALRLAASMAGL